MIGYIYITTNLVNNKKYVGRHKSTKFDDKYFGSGRHLKNALNKYGKENFRCELLESCETLDELIEREMFYIKEFDAVNSSNWYNSSYGGKQEGWIKGDENIAKREDIRKINSEKHKGKRYSDEINKKKGRPGHAPTFTGPHIEESKEKNRQATREWNLSRDEESYAKVSNHHKGSKMMTNGTEQKWVWKDEIEQYEKDGWWIGSCKKRAKKQYRKSKTQ